MSFFRKGQLNEFLAMVEQYTSIMEGLSRRQVDF